MITQDKIRKEAIREKVGITPIVKQMAEFCLRGFEHVQRRPTEVSRRRVDQMEDNLVISSRR